MYALDCVCRDDTRSRGWSGGGLVSVGRGEGRERGQ